MNGVPFPSQFQGYRLRSIEHTYTTPEVVGTLLDAIDAVQKKFPGTCDLYLGDFTVGGGGPASHHRSHQNGRDVDVGMYAKGNRMLDTFVPMNEDNLDVAKTWCLMENILRTQRVQYIFLDRSVQKLLYNYALSIGVRESYLDRLFGNSRGCVIQHVVNHVDHMHIRFYTPWSTLASHVGDYEAQKRMVIEMAQQAYLPKKVFYYAQGTERGLDSLAQSFGVTRNDLCRWNQLHGSEVLTPGSCVVFYKRGFELEPVHLAQALQPNVLPETPSVRFASYQPPRTLSDMPVSVRSTEPREKSPDAGVNFTHTVRRGDTPELVAKRYGIPLKDLCGANSIRPTALLKPGQKIKIPAATPVVASNGKSAPASKSAPVASAIAKPAPAPIHTVGRGETLWRISQQHGIDIQTLCQLNGLAKDVCLRPGQKIQLAQAESPTKVSTSSAASVSSPSKSGPTSKSASSSKKVTSTQPTKDSKKASASKAASSSKSSANSGKSSSKPSSKPAAVQKKTVPDKQPAKAKTVQQEKTQTKVAKGAKQGPKKAKN